MPSIPTVPPHSLIPTGTSKPITLDTLTLKTLTKNGVKIFDGRLKPRQKASDDNTINVVYVVGTANSEKLKDMHRDMHKKLEEVKSKLRIEGLDIRLRTFGLKVGSGQREQPLGFVEGASGAICRAQNSYFAVERVLRKEKQNLEIPEGLEDAVKDADLHIFGGQEASPDLESEERPYEPNYLYYFFGTECLVKESLRHAMVESLGLEVVKAAVSEAIRRNGIKYEGRNDWTGGKLLVEWGLADDDGNWHANLGPKGTDRYTYSKDGYQHLPLPPEWFRHAIPSPAPRGTSLLWPLTVMVIFLAYLVSCYKPW